MVEVKWGGESKLVGPEGPNGVQTLFGGHFWPFLALLGLFLTPFGHLGAGQWLPVGPGPQTSG